MAFPEFELEAEGDDQLCHGVALPCVMRFAAHLSHISNNSKFGVGYVPDSESACGFGDGIWCVGRFCCEANVRSAEDSQALNCASSL